MNIIQVFLVICLVGWAFIAYRAIPLMINGVMEWDDALILSMVGITCISVAVNLLWLSRSPKRKNP